MTLKIYNTLTRQKEEFQPFNFPHVKMYVCGPTVYDSCHIGHARSAVVFDMVRRYLIHRKYQVTYVRNFTDIDDKIIQRALEENWIWSDLSSHYTKEYLKDMRSLHVIDPDFQPKATEYIQSMIKLIQSLEEKGLAYVSQSGVYYRVQGFEKYGQLSNRSLDEMLSGSRIDSQEDKHYSGDFALWKFAKEGEPFWDSPWGKGRPGWHIECSAMGMDLLGSQMDIHGGGADLMFPHHENELAQSEGSTRQKFVKYWMHHEMVNFNQEKMSKSLKNFIRIPDLVQKYTPEVIRYFLLSKHYRSPIEFSDDALKESQLALSRVRNLFVRLSHQSIKENENFIHEFEKAMDEDFSTPEAIAVMMNFVKQAHKLIDEENIKEAVHLAGSVMKMLSIIGIELKFSKENRVHLDREPELMLDEIFLKSNLDSKDIENLLLYRSLYRQQKKFADADKVREFLIQHSITIKDTKEGVVWTQN